MFGKLVQYIYRLVFFKIVLVNIIQDLTIFLYFMLLFLMYYNVIYIYIILKRSIIGKFLPTEATVLTQIIKFIKKTHSLNFSCAQKNSYIKGLNLWTV